MTYNTLCPLGKVKEREKYGQERAIPQMGRLQEQVPRMTFLSALGMLPKRS